MRALLLTGVSAGAILIGVIDASAADRVAPARIVTPAPVNNWAGHYAGLVLGWGSVRGEINDVVPEYATTSGFASVDPGNAFLLGAKMGYNFGGGIGHGLVLGVEADVTSVFGEDATCGQAGCVDGSSGLTPQLGFNVVGVGSIVGRLGWAVGSRSMFYALAGWAVGAVRTNHWDNANYDGRQRLFMGGWTAGLGVDMIASQNVTVGFEGRYYDLGSKTGVDSTNETFGYHPKLWTFTFGTKYHF